MNMIRMLKVSRLEGLTDGVFAIAMTILVLDLRIPANYSISNIKELVASGIFIKLFVYAASFIILGTLWIGMNFQLGLLDRINRPYMWANIFYLMVVCIVPFSANLVGMFPHSPDSISFYAVNLLFAFIGQLVTLQCAHYFNLNREVYTPQIRSAIIRRIMVAPPFYLAALVLAHWDTALAFILLTIPTLVYMIPGSIDKMEQ